VPDYAAQVAQSAQPQQRIDPAQQYLARNRPYVRPGATQFTTQLPPQAEQAFRQWVQQNRVPFNPAVPTSDYDMRGFWSALQAGDPRARSAIDPNDSRLHYPDYWKTPYHQTFSAESQWATPDAPRWNDKDQLVDKAGNIIFDDRAKR
jgi:hypothetical protein